MSTAKPPKYVVVYKGDWSLLSQHTTVDLAKWDDWVGYRILSSGSFSEIRDLVKVLNETENSE